MKLGIGNPNPKGLVGGALLADHDIRGQIEDGHLGVSPYDEDLVRPASLDLRLGASYRRFVCPFSSNGGVPVEDTIDVAQLPEGMTKLFANEHCEPISLGPGELVLGHTLEYLRFPNWLAGRLEGKSGLARIGLSPHVTAGFFDPGFEGEGTLELLNTSPFKILLHPGMRIAQMCFLMTYSVPEHPYHVGGHYSGQVGPTPSRSIIT